MSKIAFFEVHKREKKLIDKAAEKLNADVYKEEVENVIDQAKKYEIISPFVYSDLTKKTLEQLPKLKMIATRSTGMDHIDQIYCRDKEIKVANVPNYGQNTVAEHAFALILSLSHRIPECLDRVRQGGFSSVGLTGFDLKGKTIGIIGVGTIGTYVVKIANGFGMNVLGVARTPDKKLAKKLGFKYLAFEEVLKQSDIVTFHVPLTKQTFHMLSRKNIEYMKKGSLLINTSRGPVIESEAILWAIEQGILAGAGLDVLEEEENLDNPKKLFEPYQSEDDLKELVCAHLLREKPNVIITPHNAFNTKEAIGRIVKKTAENIEEFLKNKE
jgi:D-lactate dehydrogenase